MNRKKVNSDRWTYQNLPDWLEEGLAAYAQNVRSRPAQIQSQPVSVAFRERCKQTALAALADEAVDATIAALREKKEEVRQEAAEALGKIRDKRAVEPLIAALHDEDAWVRCLAVQGLGNMGNTRAVEPLVAALCDENPLMRGFVVEALGKIGESSVEALVAAMRDERVEVRCLAVQALGRISDPRAVEALIAALCDKNALMRCFVVRALGQIGQAAIEALIAALRDDDKRVRCGAVRSLGNIGDTRAVEPLVEVLRDEAASTLIRRLAVQALGEIGQPAVQGLIATLHDKGKEVRQDAVQALGRIRDTRAVEPLVEVLRDEAASTLIRRLAVQALGGIGQPAVQGLIATLHDKGKEVRQDAVEALGRIRDTRAVEPLVEVLRDEAASTLIRRLAVQALGEIGQPAVQVLIATLDDKGKEVRQDAVHARV